MRRRRRPLGDGVFVRLASSNIGGRRVGHSPTAECTGCDAYAQRRGGPSGGLESLGASSRARPTARARPGPATARPRPRCAAGSSPDRSEGRRCAARAGSSASRAVRTSARSSLSASVAERTSTGSSAASETTGGRWPTWAPSIDTEHAADVAAELADDRRDGVRAEVGSAVLAESVDGLDQADGPDLDEIVDRLRRASEVGGRASGRAEGSARSPASSRDGRHGGGRQSGVSRSIRVSEPLVSSPDSPP